MKFPILITLLFHTLTEAIPNSCGDRAKFGKDWVLLCFSNPDKTLNVTFDCNLNRYQDDLHLRVWYHFYPPEMTSLTIQNCKKLNLAFDIEPRKYFKLRHMHVKNISIFKMDKNDNARCLPQVVKFENIKDAQFSMPLITDNEICMKRNYGALATLQIINMGIKKLHSNFIWEKMTKVPKLKKLVMENVQIEETQNNSIFIHDKSSVIEIVNSTVKNMQNGFMDIDAHFVLLANNTFTNFPRKRTIVIKADEVHFEENHFDLVSEDAVEVSSNQIYIVGNVFKRIEENAFNNVQFSSNEPNKYYNILNNTFHSLSPRSITSPYGHSTPIDSDFVDIFDNTVTCACSNFHWFDWLAKNPNHFNSKWFDKNNLNKCSNIADCHLNQIPKNYLELCDKNYKCSNNEEADELFAKNYLHLCDRNEKCFGNLDMDVLQLGNAPTNDRVMINFDKNKENLNSIERLLVNLEKNNNEVFRKNSEIIQLLWVESRKMKKN